MLISFFKQNQRGPLLLVIPVIAVLLWIPGLTNYTPPIMPSRPMPLYEVFAVLLQGFFNLSTIFSLMLVIVGALIINRVTNNFDILPSRTNLPALMYVLLMSSYQDIQLMHPVAFSNIFLLLILDRICSIYLQKSIFSQAFDAGTLVALASFFYFPSVIFLLFIWISLLIIRPFRWREFVVSFFGLMLPYVFLLVWYYASNQLGGFKEKNLREFDPTEIILPVFEAINYTVIVSLLVILGLAVINTPSLIRKKTVKTQYIIKSVLGLLFVALLALFADENNHPYSITQAAVPSAILFSGLFLNLPKKWISETLFIILIGLIIINLITG
jgi:hypothetical protein